MTDIDAKIRASLQEEDAELLGKLTADLSLRDQVAASFRSRTSWLMTIMMIIMVPVFLVGVWSGWEFLHAEDTRDIARWAVAFWLTMMAVALLKIFYWMELSKNAVVREVKRLELQVAALTARLEK